MSPTSSDGAPEGSVATSPTSASSVRRTTPAQRSELVTDHGKTSIADSVVAKIAGISCREISGVHDMGAGMSRTFGALKERLPMGGDQQPSPTRGVSVEVGERQAAVDLDIVIEYGVAIVDVAQSIRQNVITKVEAMTGLEVTEVNVTVDDVYLGETSAPPEDPRVQ